MSYINYTPKETKILKGAGELQKFVNEYGDKKPEDAIDLIEGTKVSPTMSLVSKPVRVPIKFDIETIYQCDKVTVEGWIFQVTVLEREIME